MSIFNNYDSIEQLISDLGLKISSIGIHKQQDLMILFLNTGASMLVNISTFKLLANATENQLMNYKLISGGVGLHWPDLGEDLSLKGFLKEELKKLVMIENPKKSGSTSFATAS